MGSRTIFLTLIGAVFLGALAYTLVTSSHRGPELVIEVLEGHLLESNIFELTTGGGLSEVVFLAEGTIVARTRNTELGLTVSAVRLPNQIGTVLFVETETNSDILDSASSIKDALSLSPHGRYIAFSELNLPLGSTLYSENIDEWNVVLFDTLTEQKRVIGPGFKPFVISEQPLRIIYSTSNGVVFSDVDAKENYITFTERPIISTRHASSVSPDGKHIAVFNPTTSTFSIFSVRDEFPHILSSVGEPPRSFEMVALAEDALYGIERNQEDNVFSLWKYPLVNFAEPAVQGELLHTFAPGQVPNVIIP